MTASGLLRMYPRAWRQRYGGEFLDTVGDGIGVEHHAATLAPLTPSLRP